MQPFLGFGLKAFWQFIHNIGCLVNPAPLPTRGVIYFAERFPETQRTISNGQLRRDLQASSFDVYNLIPNKEGAVTEVFRLLKPGGRFMIADQVLVEVLQKELKTRIDTWFQ